MQTAIISADSISLIGRRLESLPWNDATREAVVNLVGLHVYIRASAAPVAIRQWIQLLGQVYIVIIIIVVKTVQEKTAHKHSTTANESFKKRNLHHLQGGPKIKPQSFCTYLCQILTDCQNFFAPAFCRKFVIKLLLNIPPHLNCVAALPCEI